jgi:hypothetical protein
VGAFTKANVTIEYFELQCKFHAMITRVTTSLEARSRERKNELKFCSAVES